MSAQHPFQILDALSIDPAAPHDLDGHIRGRLGLPLDELRSSVAAKSNEWLTAFDKAAAAYDEAVFETVEGNGPEPAKRVHRSFVVIPSAVALKFGRTSHEFAVIEAFVLANPRDVRGLEQMAAERFGINVNTPK
jgi:hypothetical protein